MAEKVKLRDYQKSILDRLESIRTDTSSNSISYLGVEIGSKNVLVNLLDISETLVVEELQPVPLVKSWFLGMSNVRGVLYAINDLAQLIGEAPTEITSNTRMLLINENVASNMGFLVDRLIGLRSLEEMKKSDEKVEDSVCFSPNSYTDDNESVWYVLDCERMVESKEFETPYAV